MQIQTVFKAGNSNVVAIPKELERDLGIETGQKVFVEKADEETFVVRKISKNKKISADTEFKRWWREFLKENAEILDELAVR